MTAATFVGLMSVPGLAVLYGGVMQKRWSVNSMMLTFIGFGSCMVAWSLWAFKMGFGSPIHLFGAGDGLLLEHGREPVEHPRPRRTPAPGGDPAARRADPEAPLPGVSLVYFQFVFAAITPMLMLGSVLGRINQKAWIPFMILWITFVYAINAFLIWGGGYGAPTVRSTIRVAMSSTFGRRLRIRCRLGDRASTAA